MPKVSKLTVKPYAHPKFKWTVWIPNNFRAPGESQRRFFPTQREAQDFVDEKTNTVFEHGKVPDLTPEIRMEVGKGLALLPPGHTIDMVFQHYLATVIESGDTVKQGIEKFLAVKKTVCGKDTWDNYDQQLRIFGGKFGERRLSSFTTAELDGWLAELKVSNQTRKHYRTLIWGLFNFCNVSPNPLQASVYRRLKIRRGVPEIYRPEQMELLLHTAWNQWQSSKVGKRASKWLQEEHERWRALTVGLALGAFAHIRPMESLRLGVKFVDLTAGEIRITQETAKTKSGMRSIQINDNLKAWLVPLLDGQNSGRVMEVFDGNYDAFQKFKDKLLRQIKAAELKKDNPKERIKIAWIHDGLRHSSCSYFLKKFKDRGRLIEEMGHRDAKMMVEHYRNAMVSEEDAAKWWNIYPLSR